MFLGGGSRPAATADPSSQKLSMASPRDFLERSQRTLSFGTPPWAVSGSLSGQLEDAAEDGEDAAGLGVPVGKGLEALAELGGGAVAAGDALLERREARAAAGELLLQPVLDEAGDELPKLEVGGVGVDGAGGARPEVIG